MSYTIKVKNCMSCLSVSYDTHKLRVSYDYSLDFEDNFVEAARKLLEKLDLTGEWVGSYLESHTYVFVLTKYSASLKVRTCDVTLYKSKVSCSGD